MMKYYQELTLFHKKMLICISFGKSFISRYTLRWWKTKELITHPPLAWLFLNMMPINILLGTKLRLFAEDEKSLEQMQCEKWLNRLNDYVHIKPIKPVPEKLAGHACFKHIKA